MFNCGNGAVYEKNYIYDDIRFNWICFIGVSIACFAVAADFAPGGVNGLAVMANYLANIPIGFTTILINIPIILFTFRSLGKAFFLYSVKTMVISSFLIDYVLCRLPLYHGSRLLAAILAA